MSVCRSNVKQRYLNDRKTVQNLGALVDVYIAQGHSRTRCSGGVQHILSKFKAKKKKVLGIKLGPIPSKRKVRTKKDPSEKIVDQFCSNIV